MSHILWRVVGLSIDLLYFGLLLLSCAQPRLPTGGPKDTIPPRLLYSMPEPGAVNYSKKRITLVFDEWVGEQDLRSKLLLTPRPKERNPYKVRIRRNRLEIRFEHALDSNTTYTISLEEGVVDLTERNPAQNLQLSFSTGPVIDSLTLDGHVEWAEKGEAAEQALVYLVSGAEDSLHFSERRPIYVSRSDAEGAFSFTHLSDGTYRLLAFMDKNKNQVLNLETEAYAFSADTIHLDTEADARHYLLSMVEIDGSPFRFIGHRTQSSYHEAIYSKKLRSYRAYSSARTPSSLYSHIKAQGKSIRFYRSSAFKDPSDTLIVCIEAIDEQENHRIDTIQLSFSKQAFAEQQEKGKKRSRWFELGLEEPQEGVYASDSFTIELLFPVPIKSYVLDSIQYLYQDSLRREIAVECLSWNHNFTRLRVADTVAVSDGLGLEVAAKAFVNVVGDSSRRYERKWGAIDPTTYGSISGTVSSKAPSYLLELIRPSGEPVQSLRNPQDFLFKLLKADSYRLRYIEDRNQNGRWDAGNILLNVPPERITIPDTTFVIKANWALEHIKLRF